jgi:hypothetical protein
MAPCVVMSSCCCSARFCGGLSCVLCCACMCVLRGSYCVKTFLHVDVVGAVRVDQLTLTIFIFFFNVIMRMSTSCPSCRHHVMTYHVVLTSLSCVTKFFIIIFFFFSYFGLITLPSCRYFKCAIILIITYTCHHTSSSIKFFFYYYHHSCCSVLLLNTRSAVRVLWSRVSIH